jgi:RNA recognition motif 2
VGYAFINMLRPEYVVPLVERFNHRKWEKFNSEKVRALIFTKHLESARNMSRYMLASWCSLQL